MSIIRALILNSGLGKRMGELTHETCKCLVEIADGLTVFDLQLLKLADAGITDIVVTTGPFPEKVEKRAVEQHPEATFRFVNNPDFDTTNYVHSIALAADGLRGDDLVLMHGDLVFDTAVLRGILAADGNAVVVDSTLPLPEKDFKAVVEGDRVKAVGIEFFEHAVACQPLYRFDAADWEAWLDAIVAYSEAGNRGVYAENALNEITDTLVLRPYDVRGAICTEVDTIDDLMSVRGHADILLKR